MLLLQNSPRLKLKKPLGQWLVPWNQMRCKWPFLYDSSSDSIYHSTPHGYTKHQKLRCDYDRTPAPALTNLVIPRWAVPVTVIAYDHTYRIQWGWQQSGAPQPPIAEPADSFFDLLPTMDPWEWQLLYDVELLCNKQELWDALTTQQCTIASDGSALANKGSFAWIISDGQGNILVECKGPVPGAKVTSFWAEGYGILSVLQFLIGMNRVHGIAECADDSSNPQEDASPLGLLHEQVQLH